MHNFLVYIEIFFDNVSKSEPEASEAKSLFLIRGIIYTNVDNSMHQLPVEQRSLQYLEIW